MRLTILIVVFTLVVISFGTTIIQNFTQNKTGGGTPDGSGNFSFFKIYTPAKIDSKPNITQTSETKPIITPIVQIKNETDPNISIYKDKIIISSISGSSDKAGEEYIYLSNITRSENIDITNFTIETSGNELFRIPRGYSFPGNSFSPEDEIIIPPGGKANIFVGKQDRQMNFRENICTGYFDENSNFMGYLSHQCPKPDISKYLYLSDSCIRTLNSIPMCRKIGINTQVNYECNQFASEHYTYSGCIKDFQNKENFFTNNWLIWMQRSSEFFRNFHERVILKDQSGKIVTEYSY